MSRKPRPHQVAGSTLLFVGIGVSMALPALAQEQEAAVIHACYMPGSGVVYRVGTDDTRGLGCVSPNHVLFSWNQQGPAGPPGTVSAMCNEGEFLRGFDEEGSPVCGSVPQPLSVIASANPSSGFAPLTVGLRCVSAGGLPALAFHWDRGDGTIDGAPHSEPEVVHVYTDAGEYTAICTVTDANGVVGMGAVLVTAAEFRELNEVVADAQPTVGPAPLMVQFSCVAAGGNEPLSYLWEFGEGSTSHLQNPAFTYRDPGTFTATCLVEDAIGNVNQSSLEITIAAVPEG